MLRVRADDPVRSKNWLELPASTGRHHAPPGRQCRGGRGIRQEVSARLPCPQEISARGQVLDLAIHHRQPSRRSTPCGPASGKPVGAARTSTNPARWDRGLPSNWCATRATPHPPAGSQHQELVGVIQQALDKLNERQRMAVVLNKFEDMNYNEIAEVMGLTMQAVKSLLSRARTDLRLELQNYIYMDGQPIPQTPDDDA